MTRRMLHILFLLAVLTLLTWAFWALLTPLPAVAKDWRAQAQANYRHACVHRDLLKAGHVIPPRESHGYYAETCRLDRYVQRTWQRIARPKVVSAASWVPLLRHEGWPESAIPRAVAIIRRESGGSPTAWNRGSDCRGLFQIMARYYPGVRLFDPVVNVRVALRLYRQSGWRPWSVQ